MMTFLRKIAIVGLLLVGACSAPPERRWSEARYVPDETPFVGTDGNISKSYEPKVAVNSYATSSEVKAATASSTVSASNSKGVSLKDLSDHGQSSLIDNVAKLIAGDDPTCGTSEKKATCRHETLLAALGIAATPADSAGKGPPALGNVNANSFSRTIVINVLNGKDLEQPDRLQQFTIQIQPTPSTITFANYTIAQTQSSNSKLGSITQTTQVSLSGKIDPKLTGVVNGTGEASASYSNQKAVASDITEATVPLNVNITDGRLFVQKRGSAVTDITGNTSVALDVIVPTNDSYAALMVRQQTLFKNGTPISPATATVAVDFTHFAPDDQDVRATVALDYVLRHVDSGASTHTEGDDSVTFFRGRVQRDVTLIPKADIVGEKWEVIAQYPNTDKPRCEELEGTPFGFSPSEHAPIYFADEVGAESFRSWLLATKAASVNEKQLTFKINGAPIDWRKSPTFGVVTRAAWKSDIRSFCTN